MSLSRADVKCLTLKSLWGWKGWFEAEQALCGIKFAWRPSMTWIPPFLSPPPPSTLLISPLSRIKRCCYSNERSFSLFFLLSLSYSFTPFLSLSLSLSPRFSNARYTTCQDNVLPGRWMKARVYTLESKVYLGGRGKEFILDTSFLTIISRIR